MDGEIGAVMLYNRLIHHLKGPDSPDCRGREWIGRVAKTHAQVQTSMTPMRVLQTMLKVMMPPNIGEQRDVHIMMNKWEGLVRVLERDHKENMTDMMKIGILIRMKPDELQISILQQADKIK